MPVVGAAATEILGLIVSSPAEKRRTQWMTDIGQRIITLEQEQNIKYDDLQNNIQFIDTVFQPTTYALTTSDEIKLRSFRNAIINTAVKDCPDEILSQIFLTLVDNFTSLHIQILHLFNNPMRWYKEKGLEFPTNAYSAGLSTIVFNAFPELYPEGRPS